MPIIDTHQHFWRIERGDYGWLTPDLAPLYRDFLPGHLRPLMQASGVVGTVLVQAAPTEAETRFLLDLAEATPFVLGVVGWVDLEAPDASSRIAALAAHPRLVGLRPMVQDFEDDDWLLRPGLTPAVAAMIGHELVFDALVLPRHLPRLAVFRDRYPELRIVIDHAAKPAIRAGDLQPWARDIRAIAADGRSLCKISGLATEAGAGWTAGLLRPWVDHLFDCFGPDRLLFGSDWPVLTLAGSYGGWISAVRELIADLPEPGRRAVLHDNAVRAYRLKM